MKKFEYTVEGCAAAREFLILNNYLTNVQLDYMDGYNIVHTANLFLIRKKEEESGNQIMKEKFIELYRNVALEVSKLSHAKNLKVGAIIVKEDRIISIGYNGMPTGWDNKCEDEERAADGRYINPEDCWVYDNDNRSYVRQKTKPEVLHAERNAIDKIAKTGGTGAINSIMFTTHMPCMECAKSIYSVGITSLYYANPYRMDDGVKFLKKCGVHVVESKR